MDVYNQCLPQLDHDFLRQVKICANSIMVSTRTTYGLARLIYNVWCGSMLIDDAARIPTSTTVIISWVSAMTALYATKTISGYVDAIKTWHKIQGVQSFPGKLDSTLCIPAVVSWRTISILLLAGIVQITMKNVLLQVEND
jgi:hypothetical protein